MPHGPRGGGGLPANGDKAGGDVGVQTGSAESGTKTDDDGTTSVGNTTSIAACGESREGTQTLLDCSPRDGVTLVGQEVPGIPIRRVVSEPRLNEESSRVGAPSAIGTVVGNVGARSPTGGRLRSAEGRR